ncbi:MAG: cyclic nucleotide-binding domain-containing protein [Deltaproteobacteria bacterium]|nr:cyclic nucleotide-binding domain-containing protein [Deltaproteobacteria bacterium]
MDKKEILRNSYIFGSLTAKEIDAVAAISEEKKYKAASVIFKEGEKAEKLYLLVSGKVSIEMDVSSKEKVSVMTEAKPGGEFGWSALIDPHMHVVSARAAVDSTILCVDTKALDNLIAKDYYMGYVIMRGVAKLSAESTRNARLQLIHTHYGA